MADDPVMAGLDAGLVLRGGCCGALRACCCGWPDALAGMAGWMICLAGLMRNSAGTATSWVARIVPGEGCSGGRRGAATRGARP
jgi:hypothetical protein